MRVDARNKREGAVVAAKKLAITIRLGIDPEDIAVTALITNQAVDYHLTASTSAAQRFAVSSSQSA